MKKLYRFFDLFLVFISSFFAVFSGKICEITCSNVNSFYSDKTNEKKMYSDKTDKKKMHSDKTNEKFKESYLNFSVNLMKNLYDNDSLVMSPLSIMSSLLIASYGASGNTKSELLSLFESDSLESGLAENFINNFCEQSKYLTSCKDSAKVGFANSVWLNQNSGVKLKDAFNKNIKATFNADVFSENFKDAFVNEKVNKWCSDKTNGLIDKFLGGNTISNETMLMILSAVHFECAWENPYSLSKVSEQSFYGKNKTFLSQMLTDVENYYIEGKSETGFVKNYQSDRFAFVGIMPNAGINLDEYISNFTYEKYQTLLSSVKNEDVKVTLPKFESEREFSLKRVLSSLGVSDAFSKKNANFSNMIENNNLCISDIVHKSKINVNEMGTKAGSVTAVLFERCSLFSPENIKNVIFNRPFIYFVIDKSNSLPLFMGVYC